MAPERGTGTLRRLLSYNGMSIDETADVLDSKVRTTSADYRDRVTPPFIGAVAPTENLIGK
jgi:hypothetical protein